MFKIVLKSVEMCRFLIDFQGFQRFFVCYCWKCCIFEILILFLLDI